VGVFEVEVQIVPWGSNTRGYINVAEKDVGAGGDAYAPTWVGGPRRGQGQQAPCRAEREAVCAVCAHEMVSRWLCLMLCCGGLPPGVWGPWQA
jgi:hypothetical protein